MRTLKRDQRTKTGGILRWWRKRRGLSQMELAHSACISPRHMSFLETGRSRPSRDVLVRIGEVLDLSFREVNGLLESAGHARMYAESGLGDRTFDQLQGILQIVLDRYEPFGAVVMDSEWRLLLANEGHRRLARYVLGDEAATLEEPNLLLQLFRPGGFRERLINWPQVAHHMVERLRREVAENPARERLGRLLETIEALDLPPEPERRAPDLPLLPMTFAIGDREVRLVNLITTFGAPQDVAAQELRLEAFLPADDETAAMIRALASAQPATDAAQEIEG